MGKYLPALLDFLKKEKPDFISMQEVSYGNLNQTGDLSQNLFETIKGTLGLNGSFTIATKTLGNPEGGMCNAVFTPYKILAQKEIVLKDSPPISISDLWNFKLVPTQSRKLLDTLVDFNGNKIHISSVHGAWTLPVRDTEENLRQAKIIEDHLKSLGDEPFILGGDMNMPPETEVIKKITKVSNNLILGTKINQTTHPALHRMAPKSVIADYIFVSKHFKPISVDAPLVDVSDHLPIVAELDFEP